MHCVYMCHEAADMFLYILGNSFMSDSEYGLGRMPRVIVAVGWLTDLIGISGLLCDTCGVESNHSSVEIGESEEEFSESFVSL